MKRAAAAAAAALFAAALFAADAPRQSELMRVYSGLAKVSSGRTFSISTNGVTAARFLGNILDGYPIWCKALQERLSPIPESRITIVSTMVGDRVDISLRGRLAKDSETARELASTRPVDPGLFKFIPANAQIVYVSGVLGDSPLDRHAIAIRARLVEQLRSLMPPRATYRDFAAFAAPARKGQSLAVVVVFRLASAVPPMDSLSGKKVAKLFSIEAPPAGDDPPGEGIERYSVVSSFKDILGSGSGEPEEVTRLAAVNGVMGPMTLECACRDGYVFFEVGPAGDLESRLERPESNAFSVKSLLPLQYPDLKASAVRSAIYASPSAAARKALAGLGSLMKPIVAGLAPDGDGLSGVVAETPEGEFVWGWSLTRTELEALEKNEDLMQNTARTILMHGAQMRAFGGKRQ